MRNLALWSALVLVTILPGVGQAEGGAVVVAGKAQERDLVVVTEAVTQFVTEAGWAPRVMPRKDVDPIVACSGQAKPWSCLPPTLSKSVSRVVVVSIDPERGEDGSPMLSMTMWLLIAGSDETKNGRQYCDHCTDEKLAKTAQEMLTKMVQELAVQDGHTVLAITSMPSGAKIVLDGEATGATNVVLNTYPGKHGIVLELAGYRGESRIVEAVEGKTTDVSITLTPSTTAPGRNPPLPHPSHVVPGLVIAAGVVATIGGGILYALDEDADPAGSMEYFDSAPGGVALGVAGLVAIGGGMLLWRHANATSSVVSSHPVVSVTKETTTLGWLVTF